MKPIARISRITLAALLASSAVIACGHVVEPGEPDGDGGADSDTDSDSDSDSDGDTAAEFGDPVCVEQPFPVPHQREGIVSVGSAGLDHSYAVNRECDLYHYEGDEWVMVRDRDSFPDSVLDCESVLAAEPNDVVDVGGQGTIDGGFFATVEDYDEEDILDGYSGFHGHGCVPSVDPPEHGACIGVDLGEDHVCDAWFDGAWGPARDDYLIVGGWSVGDGGCMGDGTMDGFWFNPTRGMMAHCTNPLHCMGLDHAPDVALRDVWGVSTTDYYVIGNELIADFEDADWDCVKIESSVWRCDADSCALEAKVYGMLLNAIWGTAMDDVFAVGGYWNNGEQGGHLGAVVLHRGPDGWSAHDPGTDVALWDVWGVNGDDVYAVGGHEPSLGTGSTVALHYDGASWTEIDVGATRALYGVHGDLAGNVHIVGWEGFFHVVE